MDELDLILVLLSVCKIIGVGNFSCFWIIAFSILQIIWLLLGWKK